jgi:chorismate lyase/3-hydroxybenzoate synthase
MTTLAQPQRSCVVHRHTAAPAWVGALFGTAPTHATPVPGLAAELTVREHHRTCLASVTLSNATALTAVDLSHAVEAVYGAIAGTFASRGDLHPIRFWNHIPGIHADMGEGLDRYMAFNLGRYRAFRTWLGSEQTFPTSMATASGIGCHGHALVIHALASDHAGRAIENPRQVPAYHYSSRYGPRPPCFARATAWLGAKRPMLLIGGTASVRGEDSVHIGNLSAQLDETYANLQALIANAAAIVAQPWSIASVHSLRAYLPDERVAEQVEQALARMFPAADHVELVSAELCRKNLLVEVEGVAIAS